MHITYMLVDRHFVYLSTREFSSTQELNEQELKNVKHIHYVLWEIMLRYTVLVNCSEFSNY